MLARLFPQGKQFSGQDAASAFGLGLLNASQDKGVNPAQTLALWNILNKGSTPQNQNVPQETFHGTNPSYALPLNITDDSVERLMRSIGKLESGNNYSILGPTTKSGDRAYGQYQVMGSNIPAWTKEVLGYSLTPEQFLKDSAAQDAVARAKLGGYLKKYGNINDAASMWFSGRPFRGNMAKDILGTSVPQYVKIINQNY